METVIYCYTHFGYTQLLLYAQLMFNVDFSTSIEICAQATQLFF